MTVRKKWKPSSAKAKQLPLPIDVPPKPEPKPEPLLTMVIEVSGNPVTVCATKTEVVVFDPDNLLQRRKTALYEFRNKATRQLESWIAAIAEVGA